MERPPRERGRPARNLIPANSLRSRAIPTHSAPTPGNAGVSPATLFLQTASHPRPFPRIVHQTPGNAGVPPATLFLQTASHPRPFPRKAHPTHLQGDRFLRAEPCAGETPALPGGRPARNLIPASRLPSAAIPSQSAPNSPLGGSFPWCRALCGRDARAPGWASRPQPYSCKPPAVRGHSLAKRTQLTFRGIVSMVPGLVRARRPRSRVGLIPVDSLPSTATPLRSAPNPPLRGSLPCNALRPRDVPHRGHSGRSSLPSRRRQSGPRVDWPAWQ